MVLILSIYSMYLQQYYSACRAQLKKLKDWNTIPCLFVRQQRISMEKRQTKTVLYSVFAPVSRERRHSVH